MLGRMSATAPRLARYGVSSKCQDRPYEGLRRNIPCVFLSTASRSEYKRVSNSCTSRRTPSATRQNNQMSEKKIMLVDDEPNIRVVLGAVLKRAGYEVDSAEDGFAALRQIQRSMPDLLITDLRMPNMNGFELLSVVRTRFPQLPTIAISGEFLAVEVQEGPLADAFFQKGNYELADFLSRISGLLSTPRTRKVHKDAPVWAPTGDAPVMLTCTSCLRSFPVEVCDGASPARQTECIFCGEQLQIHFLAIGVTPSSAK